MLRLGRMRYRIAEIRTKSSCPRKESCSKVGSSESIKGPQAYENNLLQIFRNGDNENIVVSSQNVNMGPDEENKEEEEVVGKIEELDRSVAKTCKICFGETDELDDPFISVCKCKGSLKFIHFLCLQKWVQNKVTIKNTTYLHSYVWKNFDCEICKEDLPCIQILIENANFRVYFFLFSK